VKGPDHPDVAKDLVAQDRELGALLAGLDARGAWPHTTLVVVSDHGMTSVSQTIPLAQALRSANVRAHFEPGSAVAHVFLDDPSEIARAERAIAGLAGVRVDRRESLPASLHLSPPDRTGDLVVRAEPPYTFATEGFADGALRWLGGGSRGMHGYAPEDADMHGIFLALGRGATRGAHPDAVRMIDVAPTIAKLLGIAPPRDAEGRASDALAY
jgi:arylsulfatase A-like enzyme